MHSREQYLAKVRADYQEADKAGRGRLLDEAQKRTGLNRKCLIRKLGQAIEPAVKKRRSKRKARYDGPVVAALVRVWEIFDYPCGQRLEPVRRLRRNRNPAVHPLLYQKIPVRTAGDWDRQQVGNVQVDYVPHCGRSAAGEYVQTISAADIASGWWEGQAIAGRWQQRTQEGLETLRQRLPFRLREIHPDNDSGLVNDLLWRYCRANRIRMSRSRPYQKNANAWVEQNNWTQAGNLACHLDAGRESARGGLAALRRD